MSGGVDVDDRVGGERLVLVEHVGRVTGGEAALARVVTASRQQQQPGGRVNHRADRRRPGVLERVRQPARRRGGYRLQATVGKRRRPVVAVAVGVRHRSVSVDQRGHRRMTITQQVPGARANGHRSRRPSRHGTHHRRAGLHGARLATSGQQVRSRRRGGAGSGVGGGVIDESTVGAVMERLGAHPGDPTLSGGRPPGPVRPIRIGRRHPTTLRGDHPIKRVIAEHPPTQRLGDPTLTIEGLRDDGPISRLRGQLTGTIDRVRNRRRGRQRQRRTRCTRRTRRPRRPRRPRRVRRLGGLRRLRRLGGLWCLCLGGAAGGGDADDITGGVEGVVDRRRRPP